MKSVAILLLCAAVPIATSTAPWPSGVLLAQQAETPVIRTHENLTPSGQSRQGVLTLRLEARTGRWYPEAEGGPVLIVHAFGAEGGQPSIPGPLLRVAAGTTVHARVRNRIAGSTLVVHGLHARPGQADTLHVPPGGAREVSFRLDAPGTYHYWGTTTDTTIQRRTAVESQLSGALVVDPAGERPRDRVFVIGQWIERDSTGKLVRETVVANGKSWPHTERLHLSVGDSVRWRVVNASDRFHPMHLHGFYFRLDARGDATRDTLFAPGARPLMVTENMAAGATARLTWVPERPGNWSFHCHNIHHVAPALRLGGAPHDHFQGNHAMDQMAGLIIGMHVRSSGGPAGDEALAPRRHLRLIAQERQGRFGPRSGFGFVLQEGDRAPAPDSISIPGTPLLLTRGEPVRITVVNRLPEPTSVHWHGIELPSYFDGVPGWSGEARRLAPMVAPGDSFSVEFTPPRAGTFIYHTHANELEQLLRGMYGPLLVMEPGETFDPETDHVFVAATALVDTTEVLLLNGRQRADTLVLDAGRPHRLRLINIRPAGTLWARLLSGTLPVRWRMLAKDGATVPPALSGWRGAETQLGVGETLDFQITPAAAADLVLVVGSKDGSVRVEVPIRARERSAVTRAPARAGPPGRRARS